MCVCVCVCVRALEDVMLLSLHSSWRDLQSLFIKIFWKGDGPLSPVSFPNQWLLWLNNNSNNNNNNIIIPIDEWMRPQLLGNMYIYNLLIHGELRKLLWASERQRYLLDLRRFYQPLVVGFSSLEENLMDAEGVRFWVLTKETNPWF